MARRRSSGGGGGGHDAAGMMRWLLTYADLITLLMVFFVVMYAMSKADVAKFNALRSSLASALNSDGSSIFQEQGTQPVNQVIAKDGSTKETEEFQEMIRKIQATVKDPKSVNFIVDERGLTIRYLDSTLFDLGQANLRPASFPLLDAVGGALKNSGKYIRIEGYTDDLPINTPQFPSNWELSAARSIAVTRYLIDRHGLNPWYLASLGYGEYHPLYPNVSEENRSKNRRVDIVILRSEKAGGEVNNPVPNRANNN